MIKSSKIFAYKSINFNKPLHELPSNIRSSYVYIFFYTYGKTDEFDEILNYYNYDGEIKA